MNCAGLRRRLKGLKERVRSLNWLLKSSAVVANVRNPSPFRGLRLLALGFEPRAG
jgi:hypothetical protein